MRVARHLRALVAFALAVLAACGDPAGPRPVTLATVESVTFAPALAIDLTAAGWTKTATGLFHRTLAAASDTASVVANGQRVTVRYTGWVSTGAQFEGSAQDSLSR